jgi:hypothetical protein
MNTTRIAAAGILMAGLMLGGCGTKEAPGPLAPSGPAGRVRIVNVITDTTRGRVNAILEGLPFTVNLTYTQSAPANLPSPSTAPYAAVLAGSRAFILKRTADTNVTVATLPFTVDASQDRNVYATGGAQGSAIAAFATSDTNTAPASGQARVRLVQMSPTAGAVDIFLTAANADLSTATPAASALAYQRASGYLAIPAGTYQLRAVPAGTAPAARGGAVTATLSGIALASGAARTIVTADNTTGGAPLRAFLLTDQ